MMQQTKTLHSEITISTHHQRTHLDFPRKCAKFTDFANMLFDYTQSNLYYSATPYIFRPVIKVPRLFSVKYCK